MPPGGAGRSARRAIPVLIVLVVGLAVTTALVAGFRHAQDEHVSQAIDQRAETVDNTVTAEISRYTDAMSDLALAIGAQSDLSARDFTALTRRLGQQRLPGVAGVSLVVPVDDDGVAALQRRWQAAGSTGLTLEPAPGHEHFFRVLTRSLDGATSTVGNDLSAVPQPAGTLAEARRTGRIAVSDTYTLSKDRGLPADQRQLSFVLAAPIIASSGTPHAGQFRGWVLTGLRGGDFLTGSLAEGAQRAVSVEFFDGPSGQVPVAKLDTGPAVGGAHLTRSVQVPVADHAWHLVIRPTEGTFALLGSSLPLVVGIAGALLSLVLALLVAVLTTARDRALRRVDRATAQLQADIHRREQVEADLREREAELQTFAGVVAHDLKAPLGRVIGYSDVLVTQYAAELDEAGKRCVARIAHSGTRMRELVDDLLSYAAARDAQLRLSDVDLRLLVSDVVSERLDGFDDEPVITVGPLPTVSGDAGLLRQVMDNLIGNALKYVRPGTTAEITVSAREVDGCWRIEVADHGIGIPEADRSLLFDAFHRAPGSKGFAGSGLGLAICKRIVGRHGGDIGMTSNPDDGSCFWFTLPRTTPAPAVVAPRQAPDEAERKVTP